DPEADPGAAATGAVAGDDVAVSIGIHSLPLAPRAGWLLGWSAVLAARDGGLDCFQPGVDQHTRRMEIGECCFRLEVLDSLRGGNGVVQKVARRFCCADTARLGFCVLCSPSPLGRLPPAADVVLMGRLKHTYIVDASMLTTPGAGIHAAAQQERVLFQAGQRPTAYSGCVRGGSGGPVGRVRPGWAGRRPGSGPPPQAGGGAA